MRSHLSARRSAMVVLLALAAATAGCGDPESRLTDLPRPSPPATPSPAPPLWAFVLGTGSGPDSGVLVYELDRATGALTWRDRAAFDTPVDLAVAPGGARVLGIGCSFSKHCDLYVYAFEPRDAALRLLGDATIASVRSLEVETTSAYAYVRWDDSSTGYAAGVNAYGLAAGNPPGGAEGFASRSGCHGCVRRLEGLTPSADGATVYVAESLGRVTTWARLDDGTRAKVGETGGHPGRAVALAAHPGGRALLVLSAFDGEAYVTRYALDETGLPGFAGTQPLGQGTPFDLAFDAAGRRAFVSTDRGLLSFDSASDGELEPLRRFLGEGADGMLGVEPSGRFLYVARRDRGQLWGIGVAPDGDMRSLGPQGPAAARVRVIAAGP